MELPSDLDLPRNSGSVDDLVLIHLERAGTRDAGITLRTVPERLKFELILHSCEKKWKYYGEVIIKFLKLKSVFSMRERILSLIFN